MSSLPEAERVTSLINEYKTLDTNLKEVLKHSRSDFDSRVVYLVRDINSIKSELRLLGIGDVDAFIEEMDAKAVAAKAAETATAAASTVKETVSFPVKTAASEGATAPPAKNKSGKKGNTRRAPKVGAPAQ